MPQKLMIIWSEQWELGIGIIDEQHRGIASLINTLFYFISTKKAEAMIVLIMNAVSRYIALHSKTEEDLLIQTKYRYAEEHANSHAKFAKELRARMQELIDSGVYTVAAENFMVFLRDYWTQHICKADPCYVAHLKEYFGHEPKQCL
ncbi:bacteriohemerythrin [Desulfovibrio litoralis]|uniref:Hemerythrin-like metal-binding domain protein n=1 Tax=Desulfovibrio litoralis DSM 11393 TaxID=1121455 RepID=A0A1M7T1N9_9BACT|nr:hemerythrin family protein [Desulfovibrio litoralis]SHN64643.1 hemerythrin-like metal-binding domain protein [Desulfovibrio litoralis DSM 11393]